MATTRKHHLQYQYGPACQRGRAGGLLRGREHSAVSFDEFRVLEEQQQCSRCRNSHPLRPGHRVGASLKSTASPAGLAPRRVS